MPAVRNCRRKRGGAWAPAPYRDAFGPLRLDGSTRLLGDRSALRGLRRFFLFWQQTLNRCACLLLAGRALHPRPGCARFVGLRQLGVLLGVPSSGSEPLARLARIELQFGADLFECDDVGHLIVSPW